MGVVKGEGRSLFLEILSLKRLGRTRAVLEEGGGEVRKAFPEGVQGKAKRKTQALD